jgi:hypothetical protein
MVGGPGPIPLAVMVIKVVFVNGGNSSYKKIPPLKTLFSHRCINMALFLSFIMNFFIFVLQYEFKHE